MGRRSVHAAMSHGPVPVSRGSQIPLYHQVANDIRDRVVSGAWGPGQQIPSEPELIEIYGASRITIRHALADLAQEGLIARRRGRGSFVRDAAIVARPSRLTSFTGEMRAKGVRPSARVLSFGVVDADTIVASRLGLPLGSRTLRLERLRLADGEPVGIQVASLPVEGLLGLLDTDFATASLYDELERRYGIAIDDAHETFSATLLDGEIAALLEVPAGAPGFAIQRIGLSRGVLFEYTHSLMRGDRYRVQIRLHRTSRGHPARAEEVERIEP